MSPLADIRRRWWVVAVIALAAVAGSGAALAKRTTSYTATATLLIAPLPQPDTTFLGTSLVRDSADSARTAPTVAQVIDRGPAAGATARQLGPDWTAESVRAAVVVEAVAETNLVAVTARAADPALARRLATAYANAVIAERWRIISRELDARIAVLAAQGRAEVPSGGGGATSQIRALDAVRRSGSDPTLRLHSVSGAAPARQLPGPLLLALALLGGLFLGALTAVGLGRLAPARGNDG